MKYLTPTLYIKLQDFSEQAMDATDAEWHLARKRYERRVKTIRPRLPKSLCQLLESYYLHDAQILSMGKQDHRFVIVLRLDVPPNELLVLDYRLVGEPTIDTESLPAEIRSSQVGWLYDEVDLVSDSGHATHSILLSNGWEVHLPLRDVRIVRAEALFPAPGINPVPIGSAAVPKSA